MQNTENRNLSLLGRKIFLWMVISNDKLTLISVSSLNLDEFLLVVSSSIISFSVIIIFFLLFILVLDALDFF